MDRVSAIWGHALRNRQLYTARRTKSGCRKPRSLSILLRWLTRRHIYMVPTKKRLEHRPALTLKNTASSSPPLLHRPSMTSGRR